MGKQRVKVSREGLFGLSRDGDLIGVGMTFDDAVRIKDEYGAAYPDQTFNVIPHPKNAEKKERNP